MKPSDLRWAADFLVTIWAISVARACAIVGLTRSAWYRPDPAKRQLERDKEVIEALNEVVAAHPRWGFWKCFHRLRLDGRSWNHKMVWRVYKSLGLNFKRRTKKRLPARTPAPLAVPAVANHSWSFDFMSDALYSGTRFRVLNIIDEGVREVLDIVVDTSITSGRLVRVFEQLKNERGLPSRIRCDNGPEMTSVAFTSWCAANGVTIDYIEPGKPNQNAYIERFNQSFRNEVLDPHIFSNLTEVRELSWAWVLSYNEERPHESLGNIPPTEFRRRIEQPEISISQLSH